MGFVDTFGHCNLSGFHEFFKQLNTNQITQSLSFQNKMKGQWEPDWLMQYEVTAMIKVIHNKASSDVRARQKAQQWTKVRALISKNEFQYCCNRCVHTQANLRHEQA